MKAVLAGGSGALGRRVAADPSLQGHDVVILTRKPRSDLPYRQVHRDGETVGAWGGDLNDAVLVNLATGELVDHRPTASNIDLLRESRVLPTRALVSASKSLEVPIRLWIQASTLAIYGDAGEAVFDKSAGPADGPPQMAGVARAAHRRPVSRRPASDRGRGPDRRVARHQLTG